MKELIALIDAEIIKKDSTYWYERFTEYDIPHSPLPNYQEIGADQQMAANDVFVEVRHPVHGTFRTVNSPFDIQSRAKTTAGPSPELGEHTREVLRDLGLPDDEIRSLLDSGTAVQRSD
jgi:crotonobetainyl-CoA:carnitine CoA-transferase CaiB-like acyl-CoA transferase